MTVSERCRCPEPPTALCGPTVDQLRQDFWAAGACKCDTRKALDSPTLRFGTRRSVVQILPFPLRLNAYTPFESPNMRNVVSIWNQSAESAIGFGGRLQRHESTGLCSSVVVFDPHRPCRPSFWTYGLEKRRRGKGGQISPAIRFVRDCFSGAGDTGLDHTSLNG